MGRYVDRVQLVGFGVSIAISAILLAMGQDTLLGFLVGLTGGVLTQLIDVQVKMMSSLSNIESLVVERAENIIRDLKGVEVIRFEDNHRLLSHVAKRIREAQRTIDDVTVATDDEMLLTPAAQEAFEKYVETIPAVCAKKKKIVYREIMTFPSKQHSKRAEFILSKGLSNYYLGWCKQTDERSLPLLQFMVIDSEEVILGFYKLRDDELEGRPVLLSIRHSDIVELFQDYYNTMWKRVTVVQNMERFRKLESSLTT